jgi:hypothetical protein
MNWTLQLLAFIPSCLVVWSTLMLRSKRKTVDHCVRCGRCVARVRHLHRRVNGSSVVCRLRSARVLFVQEVVW